MGYTYSRPSPSRLSLKRTRTGYLFMDTVKTPYTGKPTTPEEQIELLKATGIQIKDDEYCKSCLNYVGYYRLFAYVKPLISSTENKIIPFDHVWDLYIFDRKLRLLVIDAIERIEVAFRVSISEVMSGKHGAFWYTQRVHFKRPEWHGEFMAKVSELIRQFKHPLIKHFYRTYTNSKFPPSWLITECLTFGTWSKVFDNLKLRSDRIAIANRLDMKLMELLSWIKCLTELRNICAHHQRLWNHFFRHIPKNAPAQHCQQHHFYQQLYIVVVMLEKIAPKSDWKKRMYFLLEEYKHLPIHGKMGFSANWSSDPIWGTSSFKQTIINERGVEYV